jgi:hypothetical protein
MFSVLALWACATSGDPPAGETAAPPGIDRDDYERLYLDRFCAEWAFCTPGPPCPYEADTQILPDRCAYDPNAAQACIVEPWECVDGSGYPVQPAVCSEVCSGSTTTYSWPTMSP